MAWEPVIGLEVHVQLATRSKAFSSSATAFGEPPNSLTDPVVLGLPGCLPSFNRRALEMAITLGLACGCEIRRRSRFARKHYFYPDLPKGYQISQYDEPLCEGGAIPVAARAVKLRRIHLEEDAGKNMHQAGGQMSHVNLNRAGVPLIEVVSEPDIYSAAEAAAYMRELRHLVRWLDISGGDMEKGQLRCDANVSLRPPGSSELGTRTELKNINSFKFVEDAIEHDITRQAAILDEGGRVVQETRLWDSDAVTSFSMRSKEEAMDYRYFPDPDLPPLEVDGDLLARLSASLPALPASLRARFRKAGGLGEEAIEFLTADRHRAESFVTIAGSEDGKLVANYMLLDPDGAVPLPRLRRLAELQRIGTISGSAAKRVVGEMIARDADPDPIIESLGLVQVSDEGAIGQMAAEIIAANAGQVAAYRAGKSNLLGFFVGQLMKKSGGKANPQLATSILKKLLEFMNAVFSPLRWEGGVLYLLDQLRLPGEEVWVECTTEEHVADAIRRMVVRGAPAIGCAAAYGVALAARRLADLDRAIALLRATRPTAVNLSWALDQMASIEGADALEARAIAIQAEDIAMCQAIGRHGADLVPDNATVLTHCNAGALATGGYGTALGVVRAAREAGKALRVIADETRPFLQGARLTAWELQRDGIDVTLIPDVAAAFLMSRGEVSCAIVGADRIAANGDVANKIGTYALALAAARHQVPFYVAAPSSTLDLDTATGADIPIEERAGDEVLRLGDTTIAPAGVTARYPAFDVTPAELVTAIITEAGVARPPYGRSLRGIK